MIDRFIFGDKILLQIDGGGGGWSPGDDPADDVAADPTTTYQHIGALPGNVCLVAVLFPNEPVDQPVAPANYYAAPSLDDATGRLVSLELSTSVQAWQILFVPQVAIETDASGNKVVNKSCCVLGFPDLDESGNVPAGKHVRYCIATNAKPLPSGGYVPPSCVTLNAFSESERIVSFVDDDTSLDEADVIKAVEITPASSNALVDASLVFASKTLSVSTPDDSISGVSYDGAPATRSFVTSGEVTGGVASVSLSASFDVTLSGFVSTTVPTDYRIVSNSADELTPVLIDFGELSGEMAGTISDAVTGVSVAGVASVPLATSLVDDDTSTFKATGTGTVDFPKYEITDTPTDGESYYARSITQPAGVASLSQSPFGKTGVVQSVALTPRQVNKDVYLQFNFPETFAGDQITIRLADFLTDNGHTHSLADDCTISTERTGITFNDIVLTPTGTLQTAPRDLTGTVSVNEYDLDQVGIDVYNDGGVVTFESNTEKTDEIKFGLLKTNVPTEITVESPLKLGISMSNYADVVTDIAASRGDQPVNISANFNVGEKAVGVNTSDISGALSLLPADFSTIAVPTSGTGMIQANDTAPVSGIVFNPTVADGVVALPAITTSAASTSMKVIDELQLASGMNQTASEFLTPATTASVVVKEFKQKQTAIIETTAFRVGGCDEEA